MTEMQTPLEKPWLAAVRRAQEGDRQAFGTLVRDFSGFVYHVAYSVLGQVQDTEDVVQETFLKAYLNLDGLRELRAFPTWLGRIARNLAQNRQRQARGRPAMDPLAADIELATTGPDPAAEAVLAQEARVALEAAIAALPDHYRVALLLRTKAELSYEEIAEILEIPVGTVRSRIHAARGRVAAALAAREAQPGEEESR